jgi:hypothetical protein
MLTDGGVEVVEELGALMLTIGALASDFASLAAAFFLFACVSSWV